MSNGMEREIAQLAAMTSAQIGMNLASDKDHRVLNNNKIDIRKFLPQKNQQARGHMPQPRPQQYPQAPYPNQNIAPAPSPTQPVGEGYEAIPLDNSPQGLLPMPKGADAILEHDQNSAHLPNNDQFASPPTESPTPSFQDTTFSDFSAPNTGNGETKVLSSESAESSILDSMRRELSDQGKEITSLKKTVKTLSTRIYKLIKLIEEQSKETENE